MTDLTKDMVKNSWIILKEGGLGQLTPGKLATSLNLPVARVEAICPNQLAILLLLWNDIEQRSAINDSKELGDKDLLFAQIMAVLDVLQPHKLAVKNLTGDIISSPCLIKQLSPYFLKWSRQILEKTTINLEVFAAPIKTTAFAVFCVYILKIWLGNQGENTNDDIILHKLDQGLDKLMKLM